MSQSNQHNKTVFKQSNVHYVVRDLGTLPNCTGAVPGAINSRGHIAGVAASKTHQYVFLWCDGRMMNLGDIPGYSEVNVTCMNDSDVIAGIAYNSVDGVVDDTVLPYAFIYDKAFHSILFPTGYICREIVGINNKGMVIGRCSNSKTSYAFEYDGKQVKLLFAGAATGISDDGYIIGYKGHIDASEGVQIKEEGEVFLWKNDSTEVLKTPVDDYTHYTTPYLINNRNEAIFWGGDSFMIWRNGKKHKFPINSQQKFLALLFTKTNSNAYITATGYDDYTSTAVLIRDGTMYDLNTLVDIDRTYHLLNALGINDMGQIICIGNKNADLSETDTWNSHALLLSIEK